MMHHSLIDRAAEYFRELQDRIVEGLERLDGKRFRTDEWDRPGGGGGRSRVLADGNVFEKAGVNFSDVHGQLPARDGRRPARAGDGVPGHRRLAGAAPAQPARARRCTPTSAGWRRPSGGGHRQPAGSAAAPI